MFQYKCNYELKRGTKDSAGYDICAAEDCEVPPNGGQLLVKTSLYMAIESGYFGMIKSRSSIAWKRNVHVGAGIIDSDYRGEVRVLLTNIGSEPFTITAGDRIAQIIIMKYYAKAVRVEELDSPTDRGEGGFGSTGK